MTASAYILGISVAIVLLVVASIWSVMISFRPDNSDCKKRKVLFWIISLFTIVLTFLLCYTIVYTGIKVPARQESYMTAMCIASGVSFILYIILGFILSKINKHGKIGNWF